MVLLSDDWLDLISPDDEDEKLNEWLDVAIDVSAAEDKVRGMNILVAPGKWERKIDNQCLHIMRKVLEESKCVYNVARQQEN
jgi:hypothetical protein